MRALIRLSTTTHNLLTFNTSEISSNNSEKLSLLTDRHLLTFILHSFYSSSLMYGHTVGRPAETLFSHRKVLAWIKVHLQMCCRLIHLTPESRLVPEAKDLAVTSEKQTISYLSVSTRIRVIDPCLFRLFSNNNLTTVIFMGQIYNKELNYFCRWMPTGPVYTSRKWILFQGPRVLKSFHWNSRIVRASMRHGKWMCVDQCWSTNKRQSDMWVK